MRLFPFVICKIVIHHFIPREKEKEIVFKCWTNFRKSLVRWTNYRFTALKRSIFSAESNRVLKMEEAMDSKSEVPPYSAALCKETSYSEDQPMSDFTQNPISPVSESGGLDSGSDSDSDSDLEPDEDQQKLELETLESELATNPSNYDVHVKFIKLLRKVGDIEKLRKAREGMSDIFPLSPAMWQEWAKDEASISTGPETLVAIESLYERGVHDYLSVSLWCDYLNFIREYDPPVRQFSTAGVSKARDLFERALTAVGLHFAEGEKVWEGYREFELAFSHAIDETDVQAKEKQVQRIRSIFHRLLSLPLVNMKSTLQAYKNWEGEQGQIFDVKSDSLDGISAQVASAYKKALEMYNARVQLEEQISRQDISDSERLHQFMVYLKFEQSCGDPARVQVLYERAITDFPISSDLWLDYTRYLDETLKVGNVVRSVHCRATRNCPWVGDLWVRYLLALERSHASEKEIATVFEKSLKCTFSTLDEYLDLFLTRADGLRRRISSGAEVADVNDYTVLRKTFQHASDYLSPHFKNTRSLLHLYAYWARLELKLGKDLVTARGVWECSLKICGSMLEAWQGYIAMEIELNHTNEARSLYKRSYSKRFPGTGSEDICRSWLCFEREFGTLEDYDLAIRKVNPRLEELQLFRSQQECNTAEWENSVKQNGREKRKPGPDLSNELSPAKRLKQAARSPRKYSGKDKMQMQNLTEQSKLENSKAKNEKPGNRMKDLEKSRVYNDQCTAFVSNLHLKVNSDQLRDFFSDVGGVVAIRILQDKFTGNSRGLAYVDFSDDAHLTAAIAKNKQMLLGKKLSIARSNPKRSEKELVGGKISMEQGATATENVGHAIESDSKETIETSEEHRKPQAGHPAYKRHGGERVQLKGKNTFAVPRNVRPLGWAADKPKSTEEGDEKPKSNNEFRKMFLKD